MWAAARWCPSTAVTADRNASEDVGARRMPGPEGLGSQLTVKKVER
jgi:hypothetical protein